METISRAQLVGIFKENIAGLSTRQAGEKLGLSHAYIADVLNGARHPGPTIVRYLGYEQINQEPLYAPKRYIRAAIRKAAK